MLQEPSTKLIERFLKDPGCEDDGFEVKRREKVADRRGRLEIVRTLSAMANTRGGTLLVGLGVTNGKPIIDGFDPGTELLRDILSMANDRTKPSISSHVEGEWAEFAGQRIMRIDVESVAEGVVSFKDDAGRWLAYKRVHSSTRQMTPDEIWARSANHAARSQESRIIPHLVTSIRPKAIRRRFPTAPAMHMITESSNHNTQPVCGEIMGFDDVDKPAFYSLTASPELRTDEDWWGFIAASRNALGTRFDEVTYSIMVGRRVLCGVGLPALTEDIARISELGEELLRLLPTPPAARDERFLPLLTGYVPYSTGLFWFQSEYQGNSDHWYRGECGFALSEMVFDQSALRSFFDTIGETPTFYAADTSVQGFVLRGSTPLARCGKLASSVKQTNFLYVEADNPFYSSASALTKRFEGEQAKWLAREFCSIPRLMFQVSGGLAEKDRTFRLKRIEVFHRSLREETLFINALASAR